MTGAVYGKIGGTKYRNAPALFAPAGGVALNDWSVQMQDKSIPNSTTESIPYGHCHCGCGARTNLAKKTDRRRGLIKGAPAKYLKGHHFRNPSVIECDSIQESCFITLPSGDNVYFDKHDAPLVSGYAWHLAASRYAATGGSSSSGNRFYMHRLIMNLGAGDPRQVDHVDGDGLNNRRSNLRICNQTLNNANRITQSGDTTSLFRGVSWHKSTGKWRAHIQVGGKHRHLGLFTNEIDAAKAYDAAAFEEFGEFASMNFTRIEIEVMS